MMLPTTTAVTDLNRKSPKDDLAEKGGHCGATLVGLRADPASSPEDWESDFDFDSSSPLLPSSGGGRGVGIGDSATPPTASTGSAAITAAERRELEELLKTLPCFPHHAESFIVEISLSSPSSTARISNKLGIKDLLREMQHSFTPLDSPPQELQSSMKDRAGQPNAGLVESQEWNLLMARGKKNVQVTSGLFPPRSMHYFSYLPGVQGEVFAHMELARTYRSAGNTGAAMLQLQHALKALSER